MTFTPQDLQQISQSGRDLGAVKVQLDRFQNGFPPIKLVRPITAKDGLFPMDKQAEAAYIKLFEEAASSHQVCKFVPASGAASRMFRTLFAFVADPEGLEDSQKEEVAFVCKNLSKFAFYPALKASLTKAGNDVEELISNQKYDAIIRHLLSESGLNFGKIPKALLPFHRYDGFVRTALEEHLVEAAHYCVSKGNQVNLHFTISEQHQNWVKAHLAAVVPAYEQQFGVQFNIETSIQHPKTDTLAVDLKNHPLRDENGKLIFRPGGHGALLENMNHLEADWVFIKNIDNVVPDNWKASTFHWKKVIGGVLVSFQQKIFSWLHRLDEEGLSAEKELIRFMQKALGIGIVPGYESWEDEKRLAYLRSKLNRPIRVCGIISTDENTGGGPFWVQDEDRSISLQIAETAQIDLSNPDQKHIAEQSRFANITDLVCGLKDYEGNSFDLPAFRDDNTGFITGKSLNGKDLKALELPGLWNGSMADWHTLLVEVPVATFNPVKSVGDLLADCRVTSSHSTYPTPHR